MGDNCAISSSARNETFAFFIRRNYIEIERARQYTQRTGKHMHPGYVAVPE
jgi:hypothetical protein